MKLGSKISRSITGFATLFLLAGLVFWNPSNLPTTVSHYITITSAVLFFSWVSTVSTFTSIRWYQSQPFLTCLVVFSFFVEITNHQRWLVILFLIVCDFFANIKKIEIEKFVEVVLKVSGVFLLIKALFYFLTLIFDYVLQFLSLGYDNAFHLALFRYYRADAWFPFSSEALWGTDFGLFNTYPSGQSALWSFLTEPIIGNNLGSRENLAAYATVNIAVFITMIWLLVKCVDRYARKTLATRVFMISVSLVAGIGYLGIFYTNGFIPYAGGILVLLLYFASFGMNLDEFSRYLSPFFTTLLLLLTAPALIAFVLIPGLVSTLRYFGEKDKTRSNLKTILIALLSLSLAMIGYSIQEVTSSSFGWRQILSPGGSIRPSVFVVAVLVTTLLLSLILVGRSILPNPIIQGVISGALSAALLSGVTIFYTGTIQYYAIKQIHVWIVFAILGVAIILSSLHKHSLRLELVKVVFVVILIFPLVSPTAIGAGWMGNMLGVISTTLDRSKWDSQIVNVTDIRSGLDAALTRNQTNKYCLILRTEGLESDLNSRWINAINLEPGITNDCFSAFWNSAGLSTEELEARIMEMKGNFLILTDSNEFKSKPTDSNYFYVQISD